MPDRADRKASQTPRPLVRWTAWGVFSLLFLFGALCTTSAVSVWGTLACSAAPHVGVLGTCLALLWYALRQPRTSIATLVVSLWLLAPTIQLFTPARESNSVANQQVHIVSANILGRNQQMAEAMQVVRSLDADILAVVEVTPEVELYLQQLEAAYPHQVIAPQTDNFGIALLSRYPLSGARTWTPEGTTVVALSADADVAGSPLRVVVAHSFPPVGTAAWIQRNVYLREIARSLRSSPNSVVVGDFNATEYDAAFQSLLAEGNLRDSRQGRGRFASWPSPLGWAGISLDHILVGHRLTVLDRDCGPIPGSDHYWASAEVSF